MVGVNKMNPNEISKHGGRMHVEEKMPLWVMVLCLAVVTSPALAVKLWKWVDKEGNIHYSETKPPPQATKIEEKQINPDQNVIKADVPPPSTVTPSEPDSNLGQTKPKPLDGNRRKGIAAGAGAAAGAPAPPPPVVPSLPAVPSAAIPQPPPPPPTPGGF